MSLRPQEPGEIPVETVRVAKATSPRGSLAIQVRDELEVMFRDEDFAALSRYGGSLPGSRGGWH